MTSIKDSSLFIDMLQKAYDTECRVNAVLGRITMHIHSKSLRKEIEHYFEDNGLTLGKIQILFHLMQMEIHGRENTVISHMLDTLNDSTSASHSNSFDRAAIKMLLDVLRTKIYNYTALISQFTGPEKPQILAILKEIRQFERTWVANFSNMGKATLNGESRPSIPKSIT